MPVHGNVCTAYPHCLCVHSSQKLAQAVKSEMKIQIALLSVLAVIGYAAAAANVAWQRPRTPVFQERNYYDWQDYAYNQPARQQGIQSDEGYGFIEQSIQQEMGEPTDSNSIVSIATSIHCDLPCERGLTKICCTALPVFIICA